MNPISDWLNGSRPYEAGVKLYQQYGKDTLLLKLFSEAHSPFKEKKLSQVLEQLAGDQPAPPQANSSEIVPDTVAELTETVTDLEFTIEDLKEENENLSEEVGQLQAQAKEIRKGWPAVMDEVITSLHAQWLILFSEKKNLQSRIYDVARAGQSDPERKKEAGAMAHRIMDLRDACRAIYSKRDHYLQNGKLPEEPKPVDLVTDPLRYPIALQNHKRYVRDYKNKLKNNPEDPTALAQLARHQWAIEQYEILLGIHAV